MTLNEQGYQVPDGLTVDMVVMGYDHETKEAKMPLIQRLNAPYKDYWALPGGFVNPYEDIFAAALRELYEETNISGTLHVHYKMLSPRSGLDRDPRGWIVSIPALIIVPMDALNHALAKDDAKTLQIFNVDDTAYKNDLAFDHGDIIKEGIIDFMIWRDIYG